MATYHLRLKIISRSLGRDPLPGGVTRNSVVAAASYRAGERLFDPTLDGGRWFNHQNDVFHKEVMVPDLPDVPDWARDRQALWVAVERSEKRKDAALARECEVMLPRELSQAQQIALVRGFVRDVFLSRGMIADVTFHQPTTAGGLHPHCHILCTTRRLDANSPTGFSATKETDWDEPADVKRMVGEARKRFNNTGLEEDRVALEAAEARRNVFQWRKAWEVHANSALEEAGSAERIDHRTLEKQGIFDRLPQISLGIARHIEKAYDHIKERVTQWVGIKKRASLYEEVKQIEARSDPATMMDFVMQLGDMAESFAAQFRRPPKERPGVAHER